MKQSIQSIKFNKNGFTVVEMIVAVAVFLTVIAVVFGIFIRSVRTQRFVNDVMSMNSNSSLSLEQIMRELRSGFYFEPTDTGSICGAAGLYDTLSFTRVRGAGTINVTYAWNSEAGSIERTEGASPASVLTAADVNVRQLCFSVLHGNANDPWRISLFLKVGPRSDSAPENTISLETTVSARILPGELAP